MVSWNFIKNIIKKEKKIKRHQEKCVQVEITRLFYAKFIVKKEIYRMQNIHNV